MRLLISKNENTQNLIKVLSYYQCHLGSVTNLITGGDFNSSVFDKNYRSDIICNYIGDACNCSDFKFYKTDDFTYESFINGSRRLIDRIVAKIPSSIVDYKILYQYDVGSDHIPILSVIKLNGLMKTKSPKSKPNPKLNWKKASTPQINAFKQKVVKLIKQRVTIEECDNDTLQKLCAILEEAADTTIPKIKFYKDTNFKRLANWKSVVKPCLEVFRHWSSILSITNNSINNKIHKDMFLIIPPHTFLPLYIYLLSINCFICSSNSLI